MKKASTLRHVSDTYTDTTKSNVCRKIWNLNDEKSIFIETPVRDAAHPKAMSAIKSPNISMLVLVGIWLTFFTFLTNLIIW